jgi:hypothetical protein
VGLKKRVAPGLPRNVREALPDLVKALLDSLDEVTEDTLETLNDNDNDETTFGFALGYVYCAADIAGVEFVEFIKRIALENELMEESDG